MNVSVVSQSIRWIGIGVFLIAVSAAFSATINVSPGQSIQAAIDSANAGDVIVLAAGTYTEDFNIGDTNTPGNKKDNVTLKAADGAKVEIKMPNEKSRLGSLAALGADFGASDRMGFVIYSDNAVIEGLTFTQINTDVNNYNISCMVTVISSGVTLRNCEFIGMGLTADNDVVALAVTPIDAVWIGQGKGGLATNLTVENCKFHDLKYPYGNANFLVDLGLAVPSPESTIKNCEFYNNDTCINMDNGLSTLIDCQFHDNAVAIDGSDDGFTMKNCTIVNCSEHAIEISNSENEPDEAQGNPIVNIENSLIANNGTTDGHNGISVEQGTLTIKNTIIAGSSGYNVNFRTETGRITTAVFDHCDLFNSEVGTAIKTPADAKDVIKLTMTNCILSDVDVIINDAGVLAEMNLDYCDIFASGNQFLPDKESITATNILNVDPQYTDPANLDFSLKTGSPVAAAGKNGTFLGAKGLKTAVANWMLD